MILGVVGVGVTPVGNEIASGIVCVAVDAVVVDGAGGIVAGEGSGEGERAVLLLLCEPEDPACKPDTWGTRPLFTSSWNS